MNQEQLAQFYAMYRPEPLHADLLDYVLEGVVAPGQKSLYHPLVIVPVLNETSHRHINEVYLSKNKELDRAVKERNWSTYIWIHERPYRLNALLDCAQYGAMRDAEFGSLIRAVWIDSENIHQNMMAWSSLWSSLGADARAKTMSEDDHAAFAKLPENIPVWRGVTHSDAVRGMSWSTNRSQAIWFARRFSQMDGRQAQLVEGKIQKNKVFGYLTGRGEYEVVTSPDDVEIIRVAGVRKKPGLKRTGSGDW